MFSPFFLVSGLSRVAREPRGHRHARCTCKWSNKNMQDFNLMHPYMCIFCHQFPLLSTFCSLCINESHLLYQVSRLDVCKYLNCKIFLGP